MSRRLDLPDGTCAIARANDGPMSLAEVAAILGITPQAVQYIERRALAKLSVRMPSGWRAA
jgi:DNA-directed RNA polymerase sigma subunit (sigma70/sigma32)